MRRRALPRRRRAAARLGVQLHRLPAANRERVRLRRLLQGRAGDAARQARARTSTTATRAAAGSRFEFCPACGTQVTWTVEAMPGMRAWASARSTIRSAIKPKRFSWLRSAHVLGRAAARASRRCRPATPAAALLDLDVRGLDHLFPAREVGAHLLGEFARRIADRLDAEHGVALLHERRAAAPARAPSAAARRSAGGVFAGAKMPTQEETSNRARPLSWKVGTSGSAARALGARHAEARQASGAHVLLRAWRSR